MSVSVFLEGAAPQCTACGHTMRRHRWCAPYACLDCACRYIYDPNHGVHGVNALYRAPRPGELSEVVGGDS